MERECKYRNPIPPFEKGGVVNGLNVGKITDTKPLCVAGAVNQTKMTIKELKELISSIPDYFIFEIEVEKEVPKDELMKRAYPYPIDSQRCQVKKENLDIGWSDGKIKLNVRITDDAW